jgi:hypothetical protein
MMKSSPAATFVMSQSQFLPEFFVVSLDDFGRLACSVAIDKLTAIWQLSPEANGPPLAQARQSLCL